MIEALFSISLVKDGYGKSFKVFDRRPAADLLAALVRDACQPSRRFFIPFLTLYLTSQREIPAGQAALMVSFYGGGSFIAQLTGGELTDRLGRRPVMLVSFFVMPAVMLALGLVKNTFLIATATFVVGFFTDLYRPALSVAIWTIGEIIASAVAPAIIADLAPIELRGLYQGIFGSAWGLAFFVGPLLGGRVYENLGPYFLWTGCLVLGLLVALGFWVLRTSARRRMDVNPT